MQTPADFMAWWRGEFRRTPPFGHHLREDFPRRWVRFHSLPGSKRYAESPAEVAEIHRRHDAVAEALLGEGEPIVVVRAGCSQSDEPTPPEASGGAWPQDGFSYAESFSFDETDPDPDVPRRHLWVAPATFRRGTFDHVWTLVANDEIDGVLLVSVERRCVFAPYDGGIDVITADMFECDSLRRDFRAWLSTHPGGM